MNLLRDLIFLGAGQVRRVQSIKDRTLLDISCNDLRATLVPKPFTSVNLLLLFGLEKRRLGNPKAIVMAPPPTLPAHETF
ncbi:hypothetical protein OUZ56_022612 [Daphnia magna]|uniref:Uncharacterized protein n=1 Tax=Daphnia magna TaxID=35525 RepID=A0ABR0AWY5_9CRUS|nr:hypothetical protein OUZ56_022612 [Daphnia magna]